LTATATLLYDTYRRCNPAGIGFKLKNISPCQDEQTRKGGKDMSKNSDFIAGLVVGGLIGAVIGILYAPKSGKETREEIGQKADELLSKAKEEYGQAVEKSRKAYEATVERLKELEETAKEKVEQVGEKVDELAGLGKETLQDGKSRLKKAIEAGVGAFREEQNKPS
jgi:gas vesicle protein